MLVRVFSAEDGHFGQKGHLPFVPRKGEFLHFHVAGRAPAQRTVYEVSYWQQEDGTWEAHVRAG